MYVMVDIAVRVIDPAVEYGYPNILLSKWNIALVPPALPEMSLKKRRDTPIKAWIRKAETRFSIKDTVSPSSLKVLQAGKHQADSAVAEYARYIVWALPSMRGTLRGHCRVCAAHCVGIAEYVWYIAWALPSMRGTLRGHCRVCVVHCVGIAEYARYIAWALPSMRGTLRGHCRWTVVNVSNSAPLCALVVVDGCECGRALRRRGQQSNGAPKGASVVERGHSGGSHPGQAQYRADSGVHRDDAQVQVVTPPLAQRVVGCVDQPCGNHLSHTQTVPSIRQFCASAKK
eukprot:1196326-Prorocentrum_minimum.AAC.18